MSSNVIAVNPRWSIGLTPDRSYVLHDIVQDRCYTICTPAFAGQLAEIIGKGQDPTPSDLTFLQSTEPKTESPIQDQKPTDSAEQRKRILDEAIKCVCSDRNKAYGAPEDNFAKIAAYWNVQLADKLREPLTAHDVGIAMTLMKLARMRTSPEKMDHYVDAAGYLACTGGFASRP